MQPVDLPNDWLIYDTKNLYEDSFGWDRKNFAFAPDKTGNDDRVILRFEGVYMDSEICVNGTKLGEWKYGYSTFDWVFFVCLPSLRCETWGSFCMI